MEHLNYLLFRAMQGLILIMSIIILILGSYLLLAIVFDLPTTFKTGPSSSTSIGDFSAGMPVKARLSVSIPDSSIYNQYSNESSQQVFHPAPSLNRPMRLTTMIPIYTDTLRVKYHQGQEYDSTIHPINIATLALNEATVYVRPKNYWHKLALALPNVLFYLTIGFIGMQMFRLLTGIYYRRFFEKRNYRIVSYIGWAVILYNVVAYVLGKFQYSTPYVYADFTSTVPVSRRLFGIQAELETNFSIPWLIVAAVILGIARAFRRGYSLQKKEHLTI